MRRGVLTLCLLSLPAEGESLSSTEVASSGQLARLLNTTSRQVHAWYARRAGNGFPEPVGCVLKPEAGGPARGPLHDVAAVMDWWVEYDPRFTGSRRYDRTERDDEIHRLSAQGMTAGQIGQEFHLSRGMVSRILRR